MSPASSCRQSLPAYQCPTTGKHSCTQILDNRSSDNSKLQPVRCNTSLALHLTCWILRAPAGKWQCKTRCSYQQSKDTCRMHHQTYRSLGVQTHHQGQQPSVHLRCLIMLPIRTFAAQLRHCTPSQGRLDIISQRRASDLSILRCADSSSQSATKRSFRVSSWLGCSKCQTTGKHSCTQILNNRSSDNSKLQPVRCNTSLALHLTCWILRAPAGKWQCKT